MDEQKVLKIIADACDDRKAENIIALDMRQLSPLADYYLICHGNNERQVQSIARAIKQSIEEENIYIKRIEGLENGRWILIDIGYIICHIFHQEEREHYNLERLWGDASVLSFEDISNDLS